MARVAAVLFLVAGRSGEGGAMLRGISVSVFILATQIFVLPLRPFNYHREYCGKPATEFGAHGGSRDDSNADHGHHRTASPPVDLNVVSDVGDRAGDCRWSVSILARS